MIFSLCNSSVFLGRQVSVCPSAKSGKQNPSVTPICIAKKTESNPPIGRREAASLAIVASGFLFGPRDATAKSKYGTVADKGQGDCFPVCDAGNKENGDKEYKQMMELIEARKKEAAATKK
eukprot:CAMPEP_0196582680 /NCGR_PEP_ID=MMETSP1081-20130531/40098_1 /TAXON_ID=36882 /ORGANISM="Pyramimonas amylifera, Strain CCMP720" /LENGTH=120 /DNA_ID=CAMNT_0041903317 /DNA_START=143 /DNA_END=505 /DNA_ORIENTATION=+